MPNIKYVGRTTYQYGKTLWEIVGNLSDYGVGRLISRTTFANRYPEPCFYKIVKVIPQPAPEEVKYDLYRQTIVWVEKIWRGNKLPELVEIFRASYKPDYFLIPKDEEGEWWERYKQCKPRTKKVVPQNDLPPLFKMIVKSEMEAKGQEVREEDLKLKLILRQNRHTVVKPVSDPAEADTVFGPGYGKPLSPHLYEVPEDVKEFYTRDRALKQDRT